MPILNIRPVIKSDKNWIKKIIKENWGSEIIISRGKKHNALNLKGYIAEYGDQTAGLITYTLAGQECEIITLDSLIENIGIGSALIEKVKTEATDNNCRGIWLITTNDNTKAMRFYQKKGFFIAAVHHGAIEQYRKIKPEIPETGIDGIPIRDEIELVMPLGNGFRSS